MFRGCLLNFSSRFEDLTSKFRGVLILPKLQLSAIWAKIFGLNRAQTYSFVLKYGYARKKHGRIP